MATPSRRPDAPRGPTIDPGHPGSVPQPVAAAIDRPRTIPRGDAGAPDHTTGPATAGATSLTVAGGTTVTIAALPGTRVTITVEATGAGRGGGTRDDGGRPPARAVDGADGGRAGEEFRLVEPWRDRHLATRRGYDPRFLGASVPLPTITKRGIAARATTGRTVLPYQHFSLVMHKGRRLCLYTACNIDDAPRARRPDPSRRYTRDALTGLGAGEAEQWFPDPRLPLEVQLPDAFFSEDGGAFDKGHVVMRESVCWGDSWRAVRVANGDTYHLTNCTPQVAGFNRANLRGRWGQLESLLLKALDAGRASVFAGPVLAEDDWWFEGEAADGTPLRLQIPSRFWKVIAGRDASGALVAWAFRLEQELTAVPLTEELALDTSAWREESVSVAALEREIALVRLPEALHRADAFGTEAARVVEELGVPIAR
jgi:endonuclease G